MTREARAGVRTGEAIYPILEYILVVGLRFRPSGPLNLHKPVTKLPMNLYLKLRPW
jgi:hypothetical protein